MADDQSGFRRCDPFPEQDLSISLHQLAAIGQPHRSIRDMLAAAERANSARRGVR